MKARTGQIPLSQQAHDGTPDAADAPTGTCHRMRGTVSPLRGAPGLREPLFNNPASQQLALLPS
jgi:hypothetical protein